MYTPVPALRRPLPDARSLRSEAASLGVRQSGFSLIEVVAAFAIFGLLFAAVMQLMSHAISTTRSAHEFTQAALYAQSLLDVMGREQYLEPGRESGKFDDTYSWEMLIEPYLVMDERALDPEENPVALYQISLLVHWGNEHVEREAGFITLRAVDVAHEERRLIRGGQSPARGGR